MTPGLAPPRVLIADDHTIVRESLVSALQASGECVVVGQAGDGMEAIEKAVALRPDIAIIDISMPRLNGIEVVRRLRAELPDTRTLVLTMHEEEEYVLQAIRAGASGLLLKDSAIGELIAAVRSLAQGRDHYGAHAARVLAERLREPERWAEDPYGSMTAREREVFHLIIDGMTTKEIARALGIEPKTAEHHRAHVLQKVKARNSADLVRYAVRKGLLAQPAPRK